MKRKEVARFRAEADDGTDFTVLEYRDIVADHPESRPADEAFGPAEWSLPDGTAVVHVEGETFKIAETGEFIRRL